MTPNKALRIRLLKKTAPFFFLGVLSASLPATLSAQRFQGKFSPYSTIGVGIGTASYYGDMAPYRRVFSSTFQMMRFNLSGEYTRHFTPRFAGRAALTWARLAGDDYTMNKSGNLANYTFFIRNLHFRNDIKELSITGIFKLIPDNNRFNQNSSFGAYLFGGVAVFAHNPKARLPVDEVTLEKQRWVALKPLNTEGQGNEGYAKPYSLVKLAIPIGFGLTYKINRQFEIAGEIGMRFTNSDYLDDVSGNYPDPGLYTTPENAAVAQAMSLRALERYEARRGQGDRTASLRNYLNLDESIDPIDYLRSNPNQIGTVRGDSPTKNDAYLLGTVKLIYRLNERIKCPPLK